MSNDELVQKVRKVCPDMLDHDNFMHAAECVFCKNIPNDSRVGLTGEELAAWNKLRTATVGQLLDALRTAFRPDDRLCYLDCVEGVRMKCRLIAKDQLGSRFFRKVGDMKKTVVERNSELDADMMFPFVDDNDVVIC